jgi:prevent-host-death family protein
VSVYRRISTASLRDALSETLGRVHHRNERVVVTRSGKPIAAIVSIEALEALQSAEDQSDIETADRVMEEGVFYDLEDVLSGLGIE